MRARIAIAGTLLLAACAASGTGSVPSTEVQGYFHRVDSSGTLASQLDTNTMNFPAGQATEHSADDSVPDKVPDQTGTDVISIGLTGKFMAQDDLDAFEADFPLGVGLYGTTVADASSTPLVPGNYYFAFLQTAGNLALFNDSQYYQYSVVFDRDDNASNNYVPPAQFADDFWKGTDLAFAVEKNPGTPATFKVFDLQTDPFTSLATASRAIYGGSVMIVMLRREDFPGMVEYPGYRATSFCHDGGFGIPPPHAWSGSVKPSQNAPLNFISGY